MKKIATVICAKCGKGKGLFGIRAEKINNEWYFTWAFPLKKEVAQHEGYKTTSIDTLPQYGEGYNGCPYCKAQELIRCGGCGSLSCYNKEEEIKCLWCGNKGTVGKIDKWDKMKGGGF